MCCWLLKCNLLEINSYFVSIPCCGRGQWCHQCAWHPDVSHVSPWWHRGRLHWPGNSPLQYQVQKGWGDLKQVQSLQTCHNVPELGACFNIKTVFPGIGILVVQQSYLYCGKLYTGKLVSLYWVSPHCQAIGLRLIAPGDGIGLMTKFQGYLLGGMGCLSQFVSLTCSLDSYHCYGLCSISYIGLWYDKPQHIKAKTKRLPFF